MKQTAVIALVVIASLSPRAAESTDWCRFGEDSAPEAAPAAGEPTEPSAAHALAVYYAVPSDIGVDETVRQRIVEATLDIRAWYQCAAAGLTWQLAFPEIVRVYQADESRDYYRANGDWWGSLPPEMAGKGLPVWQPGTVTAIWAHGAGHWAGGNFGCAGDCGLALLGVELFPEFNDPAYSGQDCPGGTGVAAMPCVPEGAFAHELGHTVGLPHPSDVPATQAVAAHSLMLTHWNYPDVAPAFESPWGFLSVERAALLGNPFMQTGVDLVQVYEACDVVNLPVTGPVPLADFDLDISGLTLQTQNFSTGAVLDYWTFGDGGVSNEVHPVHTYGQQGSYAVRLRVMSEQGMVDLRKEEIQTGSGVVLHWDLKFCSRPNAFNCRRDAGVVPLTIFGSAELDVAAIDVASLRLRLAGGPAVQIGPPTVVSAPADRGSPGDVDASSCSLDLLSGRETGSLDGRPDLDIGFAAGEVGELIGCGTLDKGQQSPWLTLVGNLGDGTPLLPANEQALVNVSKP